MSEYPKTQSLELERDGHWLTVWLNRPEARNALSAEMTEELFAVVTTLRGDRAIRGVTFRGRGGVFCAGGDVKGFQAVFQGGAPDPEVVAAANRRAGELFALIDELPQLVVMAVEGAAIAGGLGLMCGGDVVLVTTDARFALTETTLGVPPAQIAPYVARRIGLPAARRIMLTAQRFDSATALALGLADEVVGDAAALLAAEATVRRRLRACAPGANAATKEILHASRRLEGEDMRRFAAERFAACMLDEEGREGIAAFIGKRKPRWAGD